MKKILVVFALVAFMGIAWAVFIVNNQTNEVDTQGYEEKIEKNITLETYINNVAIYNQLIELEPENINWHKGLADTYRSLGWLSEYEDKCRDIMSLFSNDQTGYVMLIEFFSRINSNTDVIDEYKAFPSEMKEVESIKKVYEQSEWNIKSNSAVYSYVDNYSCGYYVYGANGKYGYLNSTGGKFLGAIYETARPFISDYAAVYKDDEWYFINKQGYKTIATLEKVEDLYSLNDGYAVAKMDGKYGYVDSEFNKHHFEYEDATSFYNTVAAVKNGGKWALINNSFELLTDYIYDDIIRDTANICSRAGVIFVKKDGVYHMINSAGEQITTDTYQDAQLARGSYIAVKNNDKWGFVSNKGEIFIDYKYENANSFANGVASVQIGDFWGCINEQDEIVLEPLYDETASTAGNGTVCIKIENSYKFIRFYKYN